MIRICDSGDVEGDGNDDKDDINEEDDLSQGFPVLLHPFWSTSSSQLLIPGYNFMSSDYIQYIFFCHLITSYLLITFEQIPFH